MNDRELLEQALEALEIEQGAHAYLQLGKAEHIEEAITALRERLAQPEQQATRSDYRDWDYQDQLEQSPLDRMAENAREMGLDYEPEQVPVAWRNKETGEFCTGGFLRKDWARWAPLYTTPPRREWVGLDRKEMLSIIDQQGAHKATGLPMFYRDQCLDMLRAIEAKLKEKNA